MLSRSHTAHLTAGFLALSLGFAAPAALAGSLDKAHETISTFKDSLDDGSDNRQGSLAGQIGHSGARPGNLGKNGVDSNSGEEGEWVTLPGQGAIQNRFSKTVHYFNDHNVPITVQFKISAIDRTNRYRYKHALVMVKKEAGRHAGKPYTADSDTNVLHTYSFWKNENLIHTIPPKKRYAISFGRTRAGKNVRARLDVARYMKH